MLLQSYPIAGLTGFRYRYHFPLCFKENTGGLEDRQDRWSLLTPLCKADVKPFQADLCKICLDLVGFNHAAVRTIEMFGPQPIKEQV